MIPSAEGVSKRSALPHQEAPTAITSTRPDASITVQRMFIHMLSRMPRNTTPAMNSKKPSESRVGCDRRVDEAQQVLGHHARLGGDGGEARHHDREPHHPGQQRPVEAPVRDVGGAARARIARPERGVGQAGEQRRHHGDDESEPDCGAELARGAADQAVDARAEHASERIGEELERPDAPAKPVLLGAHGGADDGLAHGTFLVVRPGRQRRGFPSSANARAEARELASCSPACILPASTAMGAWQRGLQPLHPRRAPARGRPVATSCSIV